MTRLFGDNATTKTRTLQAWQILIAQAAERRTVNYVDVSKRMGRKGAQGLGDFLDCITAYCTENDLPDLSAIVVREVSGEMSMPRDYAWGAERQRVYSYRWFEIMPPTYKQN